MEYLRIYQITARKRKLCRKLCWDEMRHNDPMPVNDIDHVQLAAPGECEGAARQFFGQLLGLEELEKPEPLRARGGCWFKIGAKQLHIGVEEPFRPAAKAHPAFAVSDIDALFATLQRAGVQCAWDEAPGGIRRFYANDPWGNRLEFVAEGSAHEVSTAGHEA